MSRYRIRCAKCGFADETESANVRRRCKAGGKCEFAAVKLDPGLGDLVEVALAAVGITKARAVRVKRWLGLAGTCGCEKRKRLLNRFCRKVG